MFRPLVVVTVLLGPACGTGPAPEARPAEHVLWRNLGMWSGGGNTQTESFINETGGMRVVWETRARDDGKTGNFKLSIHSAVSGRTLAVAVDHDGAGRGTAYFTDDPHMCYSVVESAGLDWSFTVDEAMPAKIVETSHK